MITKLKAVTTRIQTMAKMKCQSLQHHGHGNIKVDTARKNDDVVCASGHLVPKKGNSDSSKKFFNRVKRREFIIMGPMGRLPLGVKHDMTNT